MADYIDREALLELINEDCKYKNPTNEYTRGCNEVCDWAIKTIKNIPTADVSPKSEVEELQAKVARLRKENLELLVSKETDIYISMEKLVKVRTEHPIVKAIEEKVAREIIEELTKIVDEWSKYCHETHYLENDIAKLTKKYIKEKGEQNGTNA